MSLLVSAINRLWMYAGYRERARFQNATRSVATTQANMMRALIRRNATSLFGKDHGFGRVDNVTQFQQQIPVSNYEAFVPYLNRLAAGETGCLTTEPVPLLEPTSGSTGSRKLVPYTSSLRAEMQRAIKVWIADLFSHRPLVRQGSSYWSISPLFGERETTPGGIPIGFADDTEYLGQWERWLARQVMAVPAEVASSQRVEDFQDETLFHLLCREDLSLVSVWSPTFLTALMNRLVQNRELLVDRLIRANPVRGRAVGRVLVGDSPIPESIATIWPRLALISCWADGHAKYYLDEMVEWFPQVEIQPKGLIATEALVSFPLMDRTGSALAIRSHFFEFLHASGEIRLAHELSAGESYQPIVSTGGGFYRYLMNDVIEVVGHWNQCPLIRFVGRAGGSTDLVGEKLSSPFVDDVLAEWRKAIGGTEKTHRAMLLPSVTRARYLMLMESHGETQHVPLAQWLDEMLRQNPHYDYARALDQLQSPIVVRLSVDCLWPLYEASCLDCGLRLGDIKPTGLCSNPQVAQCMEKRLDSRLS